MSFDGIFVEDIRIEYYKEKLNKITKDRQQ